MEKYIHKVQYYETDKMGITHHSNYIRWMEEARINYLEQNGWPYDKLEKERIEKIKSLSPKELEGYTDNITKKLYENIFSGDVDNANFFTNKLI